MQRESFIFYQSFRNAIKKLNDQDRLSVLDKIIKYGIEGIEENNSGSNDIVEMVFTLIRPQIDANSHRWDVCNKQGKHGIKGKEFGKLGGRPKKNPPGGLDETPLTGKKNNPLNVNVNENVNENEKENALQGSACGELFLSDFQQQCLSFKKKLLQIRPAADFEKEVDRCFAFYKAKSIPITNIANVIEARFVRGRSFGSKYSAGLGPPTEPKHRVEEYKQLKGPKFTEKYGAEKAREVRDRRDNFEMYGVYIHND